MSAFYANVCMLLPFLTNNNQINLNFVAFPVVVDYFNIGLVIFFMVEMYN